MNDEPLPPSDEVENDPNLEDVMRTLRAWPEAAAPDLAPVILSRIQARRHRYRQSIALLALIGVSAGIVMWNRHPVARGTSLHSASSEVPTPRVEPLITAAQPVPPTAFSAPESTPIDQARTWLVRNQEVHGGWVVEPTNAAVSRYDVGVTALSMLALMSGDTSTFPLQALDRAAGFLVNQQRSDGLYGPPITGSLYNQALACLALLRHRAFAEPSARVDASLRAGLNLLADSQHPDGGWTYLRARGAPNSSLTTWVLLALHEATAQGFADYTEASQRAWNWMESTVDESGRAGYRRPGDHPHGPEALTAAVAFCLMERDTRTDPLLVRMIETIRRDLHEAADEQIDYYRMFFQAAALNKAPPSEIDARVITTQLRALQQAHGDEAGSWPPLDRWSSAGGRVYSTALAVLALRDS
ncbi:MAG TPA: terpene cyclase/mutase family protein [Kiritimatiellia bacterium]|nr:terpene cyclase/mutase family protein [Kiritimatiellia bacterium]HMO98361.1 terpene cyclase/mutase family protein [Kiritimatiellia bacterium]